MRVFTALGVYSCLNLRRSLLKERRTILTPTAERWSYSVYRTLLSESITKMDQYKRQRVFTVDRLQDEGKAELFELLDRVSSAEQARQVVFKVMDASLCAQSAEDCHIVENITKVLMTVSNDEFEWLGPVLMRMYHFLGMPDQAFTLYKQQDSFKGKSYSLILVDLLYRHGHHSRAVDVYFGMDKFDINCTTVALGSLYHINTPESQEKSQSLLIHVATNYVLTRRGVLFSAVHALNQGQPSAALEILKFCSPDATARNIELVCLCKLKRVQDVLALLLDMRRSTSDINKLWDLRIYRDAWQEVSTVIEKDGTPEESMELERLESALRGRGVLSDRTIDVFLDRVIPGDKDKRKERAKRIIHRTPLGIPS